jgi:hypothetical protein
MNKPVRAQRVPHPAIHLVEKYLAETNRGKWVLQPVPILLRERKRIITVFQDDDCLSRASQLRDLKSLMARTTW